MKWILISSLALIFLATASEPPLGLDYLNTQLPVESRVKDLLSRMTLDEKISQLQTSAPAVPRLGISEYYWWSESLHGVAGSGFATQFPQAIGLAASWDLSQMKDIATAISDEGRAKHHQAVRVGDLSSGPGLNFFSPNINIFRDPRWGRGQETYGEDPYLTSQLVVQYIEGMQGNDPKYLKTIATPKHFAVHSGPERERHTFDSQVDPRNLRDTYLPAFEAAIRQGMAGSIMCAYNRVNGLPACANSPLLDQILRKEWGFQGFVVSDCAAITDIYKTHHSASTVEEASAMALKAGTDLSCGKEYLSLKNAIAQGLATSDDVDRALSRLISARMRLGLFDPEGQVSYAQIPFSNVDSADHRALALKAAHESMVLLKNDKLLLPLDLSKLKKIAVIGPTANQLKDLMGNYHGQAQRWVTPLKAIQARAAAAGISVSYSKGSELDGSFFTPIPVSSLAAPGAHAGSGLKGEYFGNHDFSSTPDLTRNDPGVSFHWDSESAPPHLGKTYSVRWTGNLIAPVTGQYQLAVTTDSGARLYFNGSLLIDDWLDHDTNRVIKTVNLEAGHSYSIKVEYSKTTAFGLAELEWNVPGSDDHLTNLARTEAVSAAKNSDVALVFLGLSPEIENEEHDRQQIELSKSQELLIEAIQATGTPTIVILQNGSAVALPWVDQKIPAILESWYPGEEGGTAIADVLFGDYNPGGKLPITFYQSTSDLPPYENYDMRGRTYRYFQGQPLYPFGYGLSYTHFEYQSLSLNSHQISSSQGLQVSVIVRNTGAREGDEVAELYLTLPQAPVPIPTHSLQGFKRVHLKPGESQTVVFSLDPKQLTYVGADGARQTLPGVYQINVGSRQPGFVPSWGSDLQTVSDQFTVQ